MTSEGIDLQQLVYLRGTSFQRFYPFRLSISNNTTNGFLLLITMSGFWGFGVLGTISSFS